MGHTWAIHETPPRVFSATKENALGPDPPLPLETLSFLDLVLKEERGARRGDAGRSGMMLMAGTSWCQNCQGGERGRRASGASAALSAVSDSAFLVGGCGVGVGFH